jgi:hypothetical protein
MNQTLSVQKLAMYFGILFLVVFIITNIPAFNDAEGHNFGLFKIDPSDNIVHLLTAIIGIIAAWYSAKFSRWFFIIFGVLYELDAIVGLLFSRGFLDMSIFTNGAALPNFGLTNIALNAPHIVIASIMIWIGLSSRFKHPN